MFNKQKRKPWLVAMCAILMLSILLTACGGSNKEAASEESQSSNSKESTQGGENDPYKEHMDISLAMWDIGKAFEHPEKDELLQYIQKKFNITIKPVQVSWSDYLDKTKVWATSGELPDIFTSDFTDDVSLYNTWAKQGIIRALPDDMSAYPNLKEYLDKSDVKTMTLDGKYYTFPRYTYLDADGWGADRALLVRKDWMEKLGLQLPNSYDEFKTMLKALVDNDPDGNGKKDTNGLEFDNPSYLLYALSSDFPQATNSAWLKQDDKWIPYYQSQKYVDVMKKARDLYTSGLLNKDFALQKSNDARTNFAQGKAGVLSLSVYVGHLQQLETLWNQYNPGQKFTDAVGFLPIWSGDEGERYHFTTTTFWSESSFSANVSDAKMDRILQLYNYLMSDEGKTLLKSGMEGKDYTGSGDNITITREKDANGQYAPLSYPSLGVLTTLAAWYQDLNMMDNEVNQITFGKDNLKLALESKKWIDANTVGIPTNFDIQGLVKMYTVPDLKPNDDLVRVILDKGDVSDVWAKILKEYDAKGLSEAIEQVNQDAEARGIK
ncbi:extracellular solute-binding protein [Paenibacillus sp. FSL R10-2734]|uniref:extracellular solute-binding protein n=1 Tax=Paenibacillus sp. FSL R10-2734 TaxID=2954691 RepID=UPI0030D89BE1